MNEALIVDGIDAAVKLITLFANATGAQSPVSQIIAAHVAAGGSAWTDAERQRITDAVAASKAYAIGQSALP